MYRHRIRSLAFKSNYIQVFTFADFFDTDKQKFNHRKILKKYYGDKKLLVKDYLILVILDLV